MWFYDFNVWFGNSKAFLCGDFQSFISLTAPSPFLTPCSTIWVTHVRCGDRRTHRMLDFSLMSPSPLMDIFKALGSLSKPPEHRGVQYTQSAQWFKWSQIERWGIRGYSMSWWCGAFFFSYWTPCDPVMRREKSAWHKKIKWFSCVSQLQWCSNPCLSMSTAMCISALISKQISIRTVICGEHRKAKSVALSKDRKAAHIYL